MYGTARELGGIDSRADSDYVFDDQQCPGGR